MFKGLKDFWKFLCGDYTLEYHVKNMYKEMDKKNKKNKEVWHYTCECGHKWKSYSSPTGSFCTSNYGMKETSCSKCGSTICRGEVYINGKYANMGACHMGFTK